MVVEEEGTLVAYTVCRSTRAAHHVLRLFEFKSTFETSHLIVMGKVAFFFSQESDSEEKVILIRLQEEI